MRNDETGNKNEANGCFRLVTGQSAAAPYLAGFVTVFICRVTAVCASNLPFTDAPVFAATIVLASTIPSKCAVVPMATTSATCQKMFLAFAPPVKVTLVALA